MQLHLIIYVLNRKAVKAGNEIEWLIMLLKTSRYPRNPYHTNCTMKHIISHVPDSERKSK